MVRHINIIYRKTTQQRIPCAQKDLILLQLAAYNYVLSCATPLIYIDKLNKHWHLFPCNVRITQAFDVDFSHDLLCVLASPRVAYHIVNPPNCLKNSKLALKS